MAIRGISAGQVIRERATNLQDVPFSVAAPTEEQIRDKAARLALDYERGRLARVGYLTNQPRTYDLYGMWHF